MKRLLIVGAGGFGREVLCWAQDVEQAQKEWSIRGFLDDEPAALEGFDIQYPVVGPASTYRPDHDDLFICAIADPEIKLRVCEGLEERGAQFITLVHPTAIVGQKNTIGRGCILCPQIYVTTGVTLGRFVTINMNSGVGHDANVGEGTTLSAYCDVTGGVSLGKGVFLGSHASVLPGVVVGDYAKIGAGSVVVRNVRPRTSVFGVPAKVIFDQRPDK